VLRTWIAADERSRYAKDEDAASAMVAANEADDALLAFLRGLA
jgi:hypothetical protein